MSTADDGGQLDPPGGLFVGGRVIKEQEIQLIISMTTPISLLQTWVQKGKVKTELLLRP